MKKMMEKIAHGIFEEQDRLSDFEMVDRFIVKKTHNLITRHSMFYDMLRYPAPLMKTIIMSSLA
jgi:hypothetical protein